MAGYDQLSQVAFSLQNAFTGLWDSFIQVIPGLIGAIILILVGWIIAKVIKYILVRILEGARLDQWTEEHNIDEALGGKSLSEILGSITKWWIVLLFLGQAASLIALDVLKQFAMLLVAFIPRIMGAALIVIAGLLIGKYIKNKIIKSKYAWGKQAAIVGEALIVYAAIVIGLSAVGFDVTILLDAFRIAFGAAAIVIAVIIGIFVALAFKDDFKKMASELKSEMASAKRKR